MATKSNDEDTLECFLYPKYCYTSPDTIDEKILNDEIIKFNKVIEVYTKNYLWHRDSLIFHPRTKHAQLLEKVVHDGVVADDTSIVPHVYINLRYDEDIGDEWFIVFLIFKLTEAIDGLAARVIDSDGEFLLIEAADHLPSWANPETCHERVYILKGSIHIVNDKKLSSLERLRRLHEKSYNYCLSDTAQSIAKKKLSLYPDELIKRKHKARAYLPEKAALILQQKPDLISSIIRTTVHSDPLERKVCRAMRYFPPEQRKMININMTKCLYAMASSCKYTGDPRTGWNCPTTNNPQYNSHVLGIKIACGLEMLIAKANSYNNHKNGCEKNNDGIDDDKWKLYLNRLQVSGYFKGLLEGSQQRQRLVDAARDYLIKKPLEIAYQKNNDDNDTANEILNIWKNINTEDFEIQSTDEVSLSPPDDDSWINVDAAQLELMLGQHWGNINDKKNQQQQPQQQQEESSSIKDKLNAFLNRTSDIDGVEYNNDNTKDDDDGKRIDFDADEFDSALRGILDFTVPGNDGEFDGSSEGSLGGDDDERYDEIDKLLHLELQMKLDKDSNNTNTIEKNLMESIEEEAGGAGPVGNILGGPVRKFMHLKLKSPTSVPPDLQS
ncbi:protein ecdysoneless [Aphidius gifuensis]|uniref:protein ecdysoneless n=1 Tax=Aphidius gifuensis TaxID=684658 RepID=UPI001CDC110B|nr:protein ecdysoneless [Aphidius gifuensis]